MRRARACVCQTCSGLPFQFAHVGLCSVTGGCWHVKGSVCILAAGLLRHLTAMLYKCVAVSAFCALHVQRAIWQVWNCIIKSDHSWSNATTSRPSAATTLESGSKEHASLCLVFITMTCANSRASTGCLFIYFEALEIAAHADVASLVCTCCVDAAL